MGDVVAENCRFCGLVVDETEGEWHHSCVAAGRSDERPEPSPGHPMYGPRPGAYHTQ